jgi:pimeloyl-ACP methyl ester carboxylesterase
MTRSIDVVSLEGVHLRGEVRGTGSGQLVMLLHGGGQTRHAWSATATRLLGEGYDVGTYDARGHGDSDWSPTQDYALATHAADLQAVLRALGRSAAMVGASMGGISSLITASEAPELVHALVLVDIVPSFAPEGVARVRTFMTAHPDGFASLEEAAAAVRAYNPHRPPPKTADGLMRSLRERNGRLHWHWDPAVVGAAPDPALSDMLSQRLAALPHTLPLLLISGAQSDVVDPQATEEFRRQAPHAEVVAVAHAGHMVAGDRNDAFGDAISDFLKRTAQTVDAPP